MVRLYTTDFVSILGHFMSFTCLIYRHVNIVLSQIKETQYYPFKVVCFHISDNY